MDLVRGISEHIKSSQQISFSMAFIAITIMMIIVLRSFKLGLIRNGDEITSPSRRIDLGQITVYTDSTLQKALRGPRYVVSLP